MLYSDPDAYWLQDPLPAVYDSCSEARQRGLACIVSSRAGYPPAVSDAWGASPCTGFLGLFGKVPDAFVQELAGIPLIMAGPGAIPHDQYWFDMLFTKDDGWSIWGHRLENGNRSRVLDTALVYRNTMMLALLPHHTFPRLCDEVRLEERSAVLVQHCLSFTGQASSKTRPWNAVALSRSPGALLRAHRVTPVAIYMPGYHTSVDNNQFWGDGWTEWDHLKTLSKDNLTQLAARHPYDGYYDIWDNPGGLGPGPTFPNTLLSQAQAASRAGFGAFMFYHYWFAHGRRALTRPIEDALLGTDLKDPSSAPQHRRLGVPFYFSWANAAWERKWVEPTSGQGKSTEEMPSNYLISQVRP